MLNRSVAILAKGQFEEGIHAMEGITDKMYVKCFTVLIKTPTLIIFEREIIFVFEMHRIVYLWCSHCTQLLSPRVVCYIEYKFHCHFLVVYCHG